MRRFLIVVLTCALTVVPVAGAEAATAHYRSCKQLHQDHKWGVARNRTASSAIVAENYYRPKTSKRLYAANKKLDKDRDGVICPVKKKVTPTPAPTPDPFTFQSTGMPTVDADLRAEIAAGRMNEHQFRYLWTVIHTFAVNPAHYCPDYAVPENKSALLAANTTAAKLAAFGLDASYQGWAAASLARYLQMTCAANGFTVS